MGRGRIRVPRKEAERLLREHVAGGLALLEQNLCTTSDESGEGIASAVDAWFGYGSDLVRRMFAAPEEALRFEHIGRRRGLSLSRKGRCRRELSLLQSGVGHLKLLIEALDQYDEPGGRGKRTRGRGRARAVIVHGPSAIAVHKLRSFVSALGLETETLSALSPGDRALDENGAQCVIVLAGGEKDEDGCRRARAELLTSVRAAQRSCRSVVCLLEDGATLPPGAGVIVDAHFRPESMDEAFTAVAERLRRDGLVGSRREEESQV